MTKEEILDYLMNKRNETAAVANAEQILNEAQNKLQKDKKKFHKLMIAAWVLAAIYGYGEYRGDALICVLFALGLFGFKYLMYIAPDNEKVQNAQAELQKELNDPIYQNGRKGFPEKFYNYWDALRLWNLVNENRARDLQDAFNILENQHFQESQMQIQAEIKSLQEDIAASSHRAAVNSGIAAASTTISAITRK